MRRKRGLLNMLASACLVTFLVVAGGSLVSPETDTAGQAISAVVTSSPSATATPTPTATFVPSRPKVAYAVTLTAKPKPRKPKKHREPPKPPQPPPSLDFVISSFNVLGGSHTAGGGRHGRFASGRARMHGVADLLSAHDVDVVGFQELQTDQLREFLSLRGGSYSVYPGLALGSRGTENSIAWRTDMWEAVSTQTVAIPYFNGRTRPMPVVLLKNQVTGLEAWFANFHNPASVPPYGNQQRWRDRATSAEIGLANSLIRDHGVPVFFTGDMNEREEYFCRFTGGTPMIAALGGSNNGGCRPPRARAVDWIFGSPDVTFTDYFEDRSRLVLRTTDHPVILARARIGAP